MPLLYRVAGLNVLLLLMSVAVTVAVLAPNRMSSFPLDAEIAVLLGAIAAVIAANVVMLRRLVGPVQTLTALARRIGLTTTERMPSAEPTSEAGELAATFTDMLARLEEERRDATGRVLAAQEAERLRIAQELHDQVGQELTAVLLGLSRVQSRAGDELQVPILAVQDAVRASLELGSEVELVIYRVAQEALTNVARHSGAREAEMSICHEGGALRLRVRDRGRGLPTMQTPGTGMRGMRERALLIDAELEISNVTPTGCEVGLDVPLERLR